MNIIITGSSGFVGKNLIKYFQMREINTIPLSLRDPNWNISKIKSADSIIHLAGKAHDTSNITSSSDYFAINRDLTIKVFNEFLNSDLKDFFYFSSVKAVADSITGVLKEDTIGNPLTAYGKSKFEAEKYLLNQYLPNGKRLFVIRPCMIHGPGNKGNLNLLFDIVNKGIPWPLGSFDNNRSFLNIDNLCFLIDEMLKNRLLSSGIYNFADDGSISTNELIRIISTILGKSPKILKINKNFIKTIALIGDKISFPLNSERLKKLTESYLVSNEKIKDSLGISTLPVAIDKGMICTIKSFLNSNN